MTKKKIAQPVPSFICRLCGTRKTTRAFGSAEELETHLLICRAKHWFKYRLIYKKCELCGKDLAGHSSCEGCGVLTGPCHQWRLNTYHERKVCNSCLGRWKFLEAEVGERAATWGRLINGQQVQHQPVDLRILGDVLQSYKEVHGKKPDMQQFTTLFLEHTGRSPSDTEMMAWALLYKWPINLADRPWAKVAQHYGIKRRMIGSFPD